MVALTRWLAIVGKRTDRLDRAYALVYGLGLGLIGDEVGLLLTFGNYYSELTYQIFVGAIGLILLGALAIRFGERLRRDFMHMERWEPVALVGLFLTGFSTLLFRFRSRHYRSIFRFARAHSNCLGPPASARDVCSDYEGPTPSESRLGLVTAALE